MTRFLAGLALGATTAGITYATTSSTYWTWLAGIVAAVLVWTGELILDELT